MFSFDRRHSTLTHPKRISNVGFSSGFFSPGFLIFACHFAPFDVIRLPPALNLDYSVELFCEAYVNSREVTIVRANCGIAAAKLRQSSATLQESGPINGCQLPLTRISNRNSSGLEFTVSNSKQRASRFLIATKMRVWGSEHYQGFATRNRDHLRSGSSLVSNFRFQISNLQST